MRTGLNTKCWFARPKGDSYFQRSYLKEVSKLPSRLTAKVCAWDKAGKERTTENHYPDFTACIHMAKDNQGFYYLYGDYANTTYDDETQTYGRFCKSVGERDIRIQAQADYDGRDTIIILPKDPAAAGIAEFKASSKALIELGFKVKADPMPNNKSKLTKFMPFATMAEQGFIYIVRNTFDAKTYEALMNELESFTGERSTTTRKDDFADSCASAFNYLAQSKKQVSLNMVPIDNGTTMIDDFMRNLQQTRPTGR